MRLLVLTLAALLLGCGGTAPHAETPELPVKPVALERTPIVEVDWTTPLSLEACLRLAETNAGTAGAFRARVELARAEVSAADVLPNPTVSLLFQDLARAGHVEQALVGLQPFSLWQRSDAQRSAAAGLVEAKARVAADRRDLQFEVGRVFYGLIAAKKLAALESHAASITSGLATQVAGRVEVGDASSLDLDRAQAERIDARATRAAAALRLQRERLALALALGVSRAAPIQVEGRWPDPLTPGFLANAKRVALAGGEFEVGSAHPRLAHALARLERARARLALEDGRRFGLEQAVLSLGARRDRANYGAVVALQAPLPIFDRNLGNRARARAELSAAEAWLAQVQEQTRIQLQSASANLEQASRALADLRDLVARREAIVSSTADLLKGKHATVQDVLMAQRDAVTARRRLIGTEFDVALSRWRLVLLLRSPDELSENGAGD